MDNCAGKLIRSNHRLMGTYVQLMPRMVQRRMEEMESKAAENAKAAEAAASASAGSPATEASPASQTLVTTSLSSSPQTPGLFTSNAESEAHGAVLNSAVVDISNERDAAVSKPTEGRLSAATPLATEPENLPVFNKADS